MEKMKREEGGKKKRGEGGGEGGEREGERKWEKKFMIIISNGYGMNTTTILSSSTVFSMEIKPGV